MSKSFRTHWLAYDWLACAAFAVLIVCVSLVFPLWSKSVTRSPLNAAVSLNPKGSVDTGINVPIPAVYELRLAFARPVPPDSSRYSDKELRDLVGGSTALAGMPPQKGVEVPVEWQLKSTSTGLIAAKGEKNSVNASGWSRAVITRTLAYVSVPAGDYQFSAQVLSDVPEFGQVNVRLQMALQPKSASTWQEVWVFWGSLASVFLVWPAITLIGIYLLVRAGTLLRNRTPGK